MRPTNRSTTRTTATSRRGVLGAAVVLLLSGCVVAPARPVAEVRIGVEPPPPRVEAPPPPPASTWYWVNGYWRWEGNAYAWTPGHWVEPRVGEVFVPAVWRFEGGAWVLHPAHWRRITPTADAVLVVAPVQPPPPRIEVVPAPPGARYFWVWGHWHWDGARHVWIGGHWEAERVGFHWVPAHWVPSPNGWRLVGGHWQAE